MLFDVLTKAPYATCIGDGTELFPRSELAEALKSAALFYVPFSSSFLDTSFSKSAVTAAFMNPFPVSALEVEGETPDYGTCVVFVGDVWPVTVYTIHKIMLPGPEVLYSLGVTKAHSDGSMTDGITVPFSLSHRTFPHIEVDNPEAYNGYRMEMKSRIIVVSLWAYYQINTTESFIVKSTPATGTFNRKHHKIRKHNERPVYTILRPGEIRKVMGLPAPTESERGPNAPHWRRKHFHTFKHERFTKKKGQTIVIPAVWVGPSEAVVGGKRYKVMLDL